MDAYRHDELLLEEYKLCQDQSQHYDNNIWTTAGIIGLGSVGSLVISNMSNMGFAELCALGILVIGIVWIWWTMASRWWDLQHAFILRMKHIEEDLCLFRNRYVTFLDRAEDERRNHTSSLHPLDQKHIKALLDAFPEFHKGRVKGAIVWLPRLVTFVWVVYPVVRYAVGRGGILMQVVGTVTVTNATLIIIAAVIFLGGIGIGLGISAIVKPKKK